MSRLLLVDNPSGITATLLCFPWHARHEVSQIKRQIALDASEGGLSKLIPAGALVSIHAAMSFFNESRKHFSVHFRKKIPQSQ